MCGLVTDGGGSLGECFLKFLGWDWGRVREGEKDEGGKKNDKDGVRTQRVYNIF